MVILLIIMFSNLEEHFAYRGGLITYSLGNTILTSDKVRIDTEGSIDFAWANDDKIFVTIWDTGTDVTTKVYDHLGQMIRTIRGVGCISPTLVNGKIYVVMSPMGEHMLAEFNPENLSFERPWFPMPLKIFEERMDWHRVWVLDVESRLGLVQSGSDIFENGNAIKNLGLIVDPGPWVPMKTIMSPEEVRSGMQKHARKRPVILGVLHKKKTVLIAFRKAWSDTSWCLAVVSKDLDYSVTSTYEYKGQFIPSLDHFFVKDGSKIQPIQVEGIAPKRGHR